jgi:endonuclease/exonuclease/phosphatase family metal-dependent hydrolase
VTDEPGPPASPRTHLLRVVTLNVGSLLEPDWQNRRHEIVAWLQELDADVMCFQETWEDPRTPNTGGWLAEQLAGEWHWRFGGEPFAATLWPDPALRFGSTIASRWPIDAATFHRLPLAPATNGFVEQVPWELMHVQTAGLDVFSTHLAAAPTDSVHRVQQVLAIDDIVRAGRGTKDDMVGGGRRPHMPAILCGDFNAEPESDEIRFLSSLTSLEGRVTFWQDAWRIAGDGGAGLTQDWRINPIAASMNVHRKRIDYVFVGDPFVRAGDGGRILACRVVFDESRTGVIASDHAGVCVDLVWPGRPD